MDVIAKEIRASGMGSMIGGMPNAVVKSMFSTDGSLVVSATDDETLQVWDATTGAKKADLEGHADAITDVAFSPDGLKIISASADNTLKLWDSEKGKLLATYTGHTAAVKACAFSPGGKWIVSASADKTLRIWDANQMPDAESFYGGMGRISVCGYSPDGKRIATGSPSGVLALWDAETGEELQTKQVIKREWQEDEPAPGGLFAGLLKKGVFKREQGAGIIQVCYSPDGRRIVTASHEQADVVLWDAATLDRLATLGQGGRDWVRWCAFSPDGQLIASAHSSGALRLWDSREKTLLLSLTEYSDSLVVSADGRQVLSGSERRSGVRLARFAQPGDSRASPDGTQTVSVNDEALTLLESASVSPVAEYVVGAHIECVAWHPGGQRFVLGDAGGRIHILSLANPAAGTIMA
jgi:WD40 repeat protein